MSGAICPIKAIQPQPLAAYDAYRTLSTRPAWLALRQSLGPGIVGRRPRSRWFTPGRLHQAGAPLRLGLLGAGCLLINTDQSTPFLVGRHAITAPRTEPDWRGSNARDGGYLPLFLLITAPPA